MAHKVERLEAKRLYIEENKSVEEIAVLIPKVSAASLYRWCSEENWDKEREEIGLTSISVLRKSLIMMSKKMNEMVLTGAIDEKFADSAVKLLKVVERLDKTVNAYGNILLMVEEFTSFLAERDSDLLEKLHPYLIEFGAEMGKKYSKKR